MICSSEGEKPRQPFLSLMQMTAHHPDPPQGNTQAQPRLRLSALW
jgi:hypothetical protein